MNQFIGWGHQHASHQECEAIANRIVEQAFEEIRSQLVTVIVSFFLTPISPASFFQFEMALIGVVREFGRVLIQAVVQSLEPLEMSQLPRNIAHLCGGYRRRKERTRNASISTRFGNITLWRRGYRSWQRGEETIFPIEQMLGLVENFSPALLDLVGRSISAAGMSQKATIAAIKEQCGVSIGVARLRAAVASLAESMESLRQSSQVDKLLELLKTANRSSGSRKPVLAAGRDGITLRQYKHGYFEVATAATVSVYDRAGKRLGTVYLAYPPELGQATMDDMLTGLLTELFKQLRGPLPRLCYVTDSGSNEQEYFRQVLRKMKHPISGERLQWTRVADFYHVSARIWAMANTLFTKGQDQQSFAWARRMLKELKRPNGASRVLHSAASLYHRRRLGKTRSEDFWKAYRYIQSRTKYLRYNQFQQDHLPIGSGITEAACKTIYTQRLKLSGMRWSHAGAKQLLTLRTILLSGVWEHTFTAHLVESGTVKIRTYEAISQITNQNAA